VSLTWQFFFSDKFGLRFFNLFFILFPFSVSSKLNQKEVSLLWSFYERIFLPIDWLGTSYFFARQAKFIQPFLLSNLCLNIIHPCCGLRAVLTIFKPCRVGWLPCFFPLPLHCYHLKSLSSFLISCPCFLLFFNFHESKFLLYSHALERSTSNQLV